MLKKALAVSKNKSNVGANKMTDKKVEATANRKCKISARVYRAATGEWEEIGLISESEDEITAPELEEFIEKLDDAGAEKSVLDPLRNVLKKLKREKK